MCFRLLSFAVYLLLLFTIHVFAFPIQLVDCFVVFGPANCPILVISIWDVKVDILFQCALNLHFFNSSEIWHPQKKLNTLCSEVLFTLCKIMHIAAWQNNLCGVSQKWNCIFWNETYYLYCWKCKVMLAILAFLSSYYISVLYVLDDQRIMSEIDSSGVNILNNFYDPFVV